MTGLKDHALWISFWFILHSFRVTKNDFLIIWQDVRITNIKTENMTSKCIILNNQRVFFYSRLNEEKAQGSTKNISPAQAYLEIQKWVKI